MATNPIYIPRKMEELLKEAAQYFSVLSVTGPRQSGKSTILKHLFPEYKQYSMKDLHVRSFAENDPVAFLNQHPEGMFIDEVQKDVFCGGNVRSRQNGKTQVFLPAPNEDVNAAAKAI